MHYRNRIGNVEPQIFQNNVTLNLIIQYSTMVSMSVTRIKTTPCFGHIWNYIPVEDHPCKLAMYSFAPTLPSTVDDSLNLLWPKFWVGSQSGFVSPNKSASFPEMKCLEQILYMLFYIMLSVSPTLEIPAKYPSFCLLLGVLNSLPFVLITFGSLKN